MAQAVVISDPSLNLPSGTPYDALRIDKQASLITNMHGSVAEAARVGRLFYANTMDTGKVTTVDLATTYTGLCVSNPAGNSKDLIIRAVGFSVEVAGAALMSVFLSGGYSAAGVVTHTTPLVWGTDMGSCRLGGSETCTALGDSACTIVNPRHIMPLGTVGATPGSTPQFYNIGGMVIVQPGGWVAVTTSIVTGAVGAYIGFIWEEVDR